MNVPRSLRALGAAGLVALGGLNSGCAEKQEECYTVPVLDPVVAFNFGKTVEVCLGSDKCDSDEVKVDGLCEDTCNADGKLGAELGDHCIAVERLNDNDDNGSGSSSGGNNDQPAQCEEISLMLDFTGKDCAGIQVDPHGNQSSYNLGNEAIFTRCEGNEDPVLAGAGYDGVTSGANTGTELCYGNSKEIAAAKGYDLNNCNAGSNCANYLVSPEAVKVAIQMLVTGQVPCDIPPSAEDGTFKGAAIAILRAK